MKHLITFCDLNNALSFNKRRLSRDRKIHEKLELITQKPILMDEYSFSQYGTDKDIRLEEADILERISKEDDLWVLMERTVPDTVLDQVDEIILYRFERKYPGDQFLKIPADFQCTEKEEFEGFSHEKITQETWKRT